MRTKLSKLAQSHSPTHNGGNTMRKQFSKLALTASLVLAITFTLQNCARNPGTADPASCFPIQEHAGGDENVEYGSLLDSRDNKTYKTVKIGEQIWMAENLNYAARDSKCGTVLEGKGKVTDENTAYCDTYGRLYYWKTAVAVCPSGWHLPSNAEWDALTNHIGILAGIKLRTKSGWLNTDKGCSGNGTDVYGFSALPGGNAQSGNLMNNLLNLGSFGLWWSSTVYETNKDFFYNRVISKTTGDVRKDFGTDIYLYSVRCVKD